jgi:hypothetical protein
MDQKTAKQFEEILKKALANVLTKDDTKSFLTKDDAKNFLTKDDAKNFATKDDLRKLKADLIEEIKESEAFIVGSADRNKADKSVVEGLEKRVTKIERKLTL